MNSCQGKSKLERLCHAITGNWNQRTPVEVWERAMRQAGMRQELQNIEVVFDGFQDYSEHIRLRQRLDKKITFPVEPHSPGERSVS